jgi:PadR family transcriptional regulator, regulatory protein AphA
MLKYVLLGSLYYRPMTGYELKQFMDTSTANFWHANLSQIYVTLKALEADGLVASDTIVQESRPDRRVYTLTGQGSQELNAWLREVNIETIQPKEPLLLKLFFSARVDKDILLAELRLQREIHEKTLDVYRTETRETISQIATQAPHLKKDALLWEATRRSGETIEEAILLWLDETVAMIVKEF